MTLTVPRSNADPGRAARPGPLAVSGVGDAFAAFGDTLMAVGTAVETDRLDREMQRLQVDMTRDLNDLRLQTEQIGDPDGAEAAWEQGINTLKTQYGEGQKDGRPLVDPKNADRFQLAFDDLANRHAFSLGRRTLELRRAEREATFIDYVHEATRAYAAGDDGIRDKTLADLDAMIDADVAAGRFDAAEGARRKQEFRAQGDNARAITLIGTDPDSYQAARRGGEFSGLPAGLLARYDVQAASAIERRQAAVAEAADKAERARQKEIGDRLSEIRSIAGDGREAVDEAFLDTADVRNHPDFAETRAALSLRDEGQLVAKMSPRELRAALDAESKRKVGHDWETERAQVLRDALEAHEEGYARDPVAYAAKQGLAVPELPQFDPQNPGAFQEALQERTLFADEMWGAGYTDTVRYFSNDELEDMKAAASSEADPNTRAALALALNTGLTGANPEAVAAMGLDPVFTFAGELQAGGGSSKLAAKILRGQQVIDAGNVVVPPAKDRIDAGFSLLQGLFGELPGGEAIEAQVRAAADAHYAATVRKSDPAADIDEDIYLQSLHEVLGGTGTTGRAGATGGIQEVRGVATMLPMGVTSDQVESALARLGTVRAEPKAGQRPTREGDAQALETQLRAISDGRMPAFAGEPATADDLEDLQLQAVGPDTYIFVYPVADGWRQVMDEGGEPFSFSMRALLREETR